MRGSNEAEVVLAFRAENEASAELEDIRNETREADRGFQGLNRSTIATGLGFLGLGFGLKEASATFQDVNASQAQVQGTLALLGPAAQKAFDELAPAFADIATTVAATEQEIGEAFAIIIANSGGLAPSAEELAAAFDLARTAGADFETVAAAIGQALQGNLDPLEQLLDPSGRRSIASLNQAIDRTKESSRASITEIDRFTASLKNLAEQFVVLNQGDQTFFDELLFTILPVAKIIADLIEASGALDDLFGGGGGGPDPLGGFKTGGISAENMAFLNAAAEAGVIPPFGPTTPVTPITINIGSIDDDARLQELVRQIENIIRNNNRDGVNVSTSGG